MQQPRIWLVEDELSIADTLVYMLQQEGFIVTAFERGLPALDAVHLQVPDLAILDVGLPDISGWSLTVTWFALIAWADCEPHIASVSDARWVPIAGLADYSLAFDHQKIIAAALHRLRQKTMYSLLPVYCLPETFTHGQLQEATEVILGQSIQRKSLIRRFEASGMFEETGESMATGTRKARLWRRKPGGDIHLFSRNLLTD